MRILILDSESRRLRQLRIILSCLGRRLENVHNAGDWNTASCLVSKQPFDYAFVYLDPASESRFDLVGRLRGKVQASTRLIAYGPAVTRQDVLHALSAGASGFLTYPFAASDIEFALRLPAPARSGAPKPRITNRPGGTADASPSESREEPPN